MAEAFELQASALPNAVLVAFTGREALSACFHFRVFVSVPPDDVPARDDVLQTSVTLTVVANDSPGPYNGVVTHMSVLEETEERAIVEVVVRPKLWNLSLSKHSRVFTKTTVPDVLTEVLDEEGIAHELKLGGTYEDEEHITQYKESNFSFLSRLMEHEGIYYFFQHEDGAHTLIITDDKGNHEPSRLDVIGYHPVVGGDLGPDLFERFAEQRKLVPGTFKISDYDYGKPVLSLEGEAGADDVATGAVVVHGARAFSASQAKQLAKVRAERALTEKRSFRGHGTAFHVRPGYAFTLGGHPRFEMNADYLCTEIEHIGNARVRSRELGDKLGVPPDAVYQVRVNAITLDVQFRPARTTRRPLISGLERGVVDGDADSDYAQLDEDGRYNVKLGFDESENAGERSSVRTRMMQPHAGNPEGWHLPLRKETEVLVAFVNGDPDRPVIAGGVPNAVTPSVVTSNNHTKNVFHSGGDNTIEIEDDDGNQWFVVRSPTKDSYLHLGTPHDGTDHTPPSPTHQVVAHTDANCRFEIGSDQDILVGGNLTETVQKDVTEIYDTSQTSKVKGPQSTTVHGNVEEIYKTGHKTTVTDAVSEIYLATQDTKVTGDRFELYDTSHKSLVVGGATHNYDSYESNVLCDSTQIYGGNSMTLASGAVDFKFDSSVMQMFGPTTIISPSSDWTWQSGAGIVTPSWTSMFVSLGEINASNNRTGGTTWTLACSFELITLKYEISTISAAAIGAKIEGTIFTAEVYGVKQALSGAFITTSATKVQKASIKKWGN